MSTTRKLSKRDVARALVAYQMRQDELPEAIERLRSVQFDPLHPVGCNHDLVLQARVKEYKVGDWQAAAYQKRHVYDGWDKQASLVPYSGWAVRRIFHEWFRERFEEFYRTYPHAIDAVLKELSERGPLLPKELEFQQHMPDWKDTWYGPSLAKRALRALWNTGQVMTTSRRGNHHVYDLTERVAPAEILAAPPMTEEESIKGILLDRHIGMGLIRPSAAYEVWSMPTVKTNRRQLIRDLVRERLLVELDIEGVAAHATPEFLGFLDAPRPSGRVVFLAPLDQFMWDRKMIQHLFGFDYIWEVYKPESERRWGHYVLPILHGETFVARFEPVSKKGALEIKRWHWEPGVKISASFWPEFERALRRFMAYCAATELILADGVDPRVGEAFRINQEEKEA